MSVQTSNAELAEVDADLGDEVLKTELSWDFEEKWWGETARFSDGPLSAGAEDRDGDFSTWWVKCGKTEIASGESSSIEPYHFHAAVAAAEKAVLDWRASVHKGIERLRSPR